MDDDGYLTMDALTGLSLTVLAMVVVLTAYAAALTMGRRAAAERQAGALGLWVLQTQWPGLNGPGQRQGFGPGGWRWNLDAAIADQREAIALCHVQVTVSRERVVSRRFETDRSCAWS